MITITQQFETEAEAREALSWRKYSVALNNIKYEARQLVKYGEDDPRDMLERLYKTILEELDDAGWEDE
jgi:hypothetical protein